VEHEWLKKLVFIYYNLCLLTKQLKPNYMDPIALDNIDPIPLDNIEPVSDWVMEDDPLDNWSWLDTHANDPFGTQYLTH
jgi:hypothetical protein